jgi:hypothetical protein
MKYQILLVAATAFAATVNEALAAEDQAMVLDHPVLAPDGRIGAVLQTNQSNNYKHASGALQSVELLRGTPEKVSEKLAALVEKNPCVRPLALLIPPATGKKQAAADAEAEPPKSSNSVILIIGTHQP